MKEYRSLTETEIAQLSQQGCTAACWSDVKVATEFKPDYVKNTRFSGMVKLGVFEGEFLLPGGLVKHAGLHYVTLHNVTVADNCLHNS